MKSFGPTSLQIETIIFIEFSFILVLLIIMCLSAFMTRFNGEGDDDDHSKLMEDDNSKQQEEEALSLCDLPIKEEVNQQNTINSNLKSNKAAASLLEEGEKFEFGSWVGSVLTESEICVADEVFFQGQILPLRHSVSSDNGFSLRRQDSNPSITINPSRSESMDRSSFGVYTSSRSSSSKSHNSIASTSTSTTTTSSGHYKPLKNIFHSHPSPKPQIWNSNNSKSIRRNVKGRTGKSTTWGLFRVGLVKIPQIELQDLRLRNYKSFNSSCSSSGSSSGSSNKSSSIKNISTADNNVPNGRLSKGGNDGEKKKMRRFYLFESCKCSIDTVENTVSSNIAVIKSSLNSKKKICSNGSELMKDEVIMKKEKEDQIDDEKEIKIKEKKKEHGMNQKDLMNHLRTFEWLKELSVADVPD